jgi:hypothetical protein
MAPPTAFNFLALGLALMFLSVEWRRVWRLAQWLALIALLVGVCGLLGCVYGAKLLTIMICKKQRKGNFWMELMTTGSETGTEFLT